MLFLPVSFLIIAMFTLGVSLMLSALAVYFEHIVHMYGVAPIALLYLTPIIYPTSLVPEVVRPLLALNPLTGIIESFRACLIPGRPIPVDLLGISLAMTALVLLVGARYFRKTEREFADIV